MTYQIGDVAKRLDNGREVKIKEVNAIGPLAFYLTKDCQDGHTAILQGDQLRPAVLKV